MRKWLITSILVLMMVFVAACGSSETVSSNNSEGNNNNEAGSRETAPPKDNSESAVPADQPVELVFYSTSGDSEESFNLRFGDAIREQFPHYTIQYVRAGEGTGLDEYITSGQQMDIYWDSIGKLTPALIDRNLKSDMTALIDKHNVDLTALEQTAVEGIKNFADNDEIYGVPIFNNNMVLYYNKDIFDRFGVDYPTDGMTWAEAAEMSHKLTRSDDGKLYAGLSSSPGHMIINNQLSLPLIDPGTHTATINTNDLWRKYYETVFLAVTDTPGYREYMESIGGGYPYRNEFLVDQTLAMFAWLSSIVFVFPDDYSSMNWDMVALPTFEDHPGIGSQGYPTYFSITSISDNPDASMQVIKHLISKEVQIELAKTGVMPVLTDDEVIAAYGSESFFSDKNVGAAFYNQFAPISVKTKYDNLAEAPYWRAIDGVIQTGDMNTVFREKAEEVNQAIQERKAGE